jgi:hypothetical protein
MTRLKSGIAVGVAAAAMTVVVVVSVINWQVIGSAGIDLNGWIALILGVLVTLALGVGLMALVFISNRRGYDDPPGGGPPDDR